MDADPSNRNKAKPHNFASDRPIDDLDADKLGRRLFAESLAAAILSWPGDSSLVIGLFGKWGSGKTSTKNFILKLIPPLARPNLPQPLIIHFNPWWFSQQGSLTEAFFGEIGQLLAVNREGPFQSIGKLLRRMPRYLRVGARVADVYGELLLIPLAIVSIAISFVDNALIRVLLILFFALLLFTARTTGLMQRLLDKSSGLFDELGGAEPSASAKKAELTTQLQTIPRNILVVIDDVDRLTSSEVREMLQLVKANADFPRLIYLVLCERVTIERSIERDSPVSGRDFISKIFQVQFDIPLPHLRHVSEILAGRLSALLDPFGALTFEQRSRWASLYNQGLLQYFATLRDVNRFLGSLEFQIGIYNNAGILEVNPIDLVAIELLRLFDPDVYDRIRIAKDDLLADYDGQSRQHGIELARVRIQGMIDASPQERRPSLRKVLVLLFPQVTRLVNERDYAIGDSAEWVREKRICTEAFFDRYFALALREDELSEADFEFVRLNMSDTDTLMAHYSHLIDRGLLRELLDRLEAHKSTLPLEHATTFVASLFRLGDTLPKEPLTLEMDSEMRLIRVVHWYLDQEPVAATRASLLRKAMQNAEAVWIASILMAMELERNERQISQSDLLVADSELAPTVAVCVDIIEKHVRANSLQRCAYLGRVLFAWAKMTSYENVQKWTSNLIQGERGPIELIVGLIQIGYRHRAKELPRRTMSLYLTELSKIVDLDEFDAAVERSRLVVLTDYERQALAAYDRAVARQKAGLDDYLRVDDDDES